mgnify:CR=1 FL=1
MHFSWSGGIKSFALFRLVDNFGEFGVEFGEKTVGNVLLFCDERRGGVANTVTVWNFVRKRS